MGDVIEIQVTGLDKLLKGIDQFPKEIARNMSFAGHEASKEILGVEGLQKYPPSTSANQPPVPYYVRGRGTETAKGNLGNSENLSKQWSVKREGWTTTIGNRASYAKWVHGEEQASFMAPKGWRKLWDVAQSKIPEITKIYQSWINKTIKDCGL